MPPPKQHTRWFVRDLKTDPVIMACCNSSDCNSTSGIPLGSSDVSKIMTNTRSYKKMQCTNWTMDNASSKVAKDYEVVDAYMIWFIRHAVDQRL